MEATEIKGGIGEWFWGSSFSLMGLKNGDPAVQIFLDDLKKVVDHYGSDKVMGWISEAMNSPHALII